MLAFVWGVEIISKPQGKEEQLKINRNNLRDTVRPHNIQGMRIYDNTHIVTARNELHF